MIAQQGTLDVTTTPTFGRRQTPAESPSASPVAFSTHAIPAPRADVLSAETLAKPLSPEAEAFRAQVRASLGGSTDDDFTRWQRSQQGGRVVAWGLSIALMAPGGLCFLLKVDAATSVFVEVAGVALGWYLRHRRRQYIRQVVNWADPDSDLVAADPADAS